MKLFAWGLTAGLALVAAGWDAASAQSAGPKHGPLHATPISNCWRKVGFGHGPGYHSFNCCRPADMLPVTAPRRLQTPPLLPSETYVGQSVMAPSHFEAWDIPRQRVATAPVPCEMSAPTLAPTPALPAEPTPAQPTETVPPGVTPYYTAPPDSAPHEVPPSGFEPQPNLAPPAPTSPAPGGEHPSPPASQRPVSLRPSVRYSVPRSRPTPTVAPPASMPLTSLDPWGSAGPTLGSPAR